MKKLTNYTKSFLIISGTVLILCPFLGFLIKDNNFTPIKIFKNLSAPIFIIYYSANWIYLTHKIKKMKANKTFLGNRIEKMMACKISGVTEIFRKQNAIEAKLWRREYELEFTSITLRILAILSSLLIIILYLFKKL